MRENPYQSDEIKISSGGDARRTTDEQEKTQSVDGRVGGYRSVALLFVWLRNDLFGVGARYARAVAYQGNDRR